MKFKQQSIPHPQPHALLAAYTRPTATTLVFGQPLKGFQDDEFTITDDSGAPVFVVGGGEFADHKEPRTLSSPSGQLLLTVQDGGGSWKAPVFRCETPDGQLFRVEPKGVFRKTPIVYPDGSPLAVLKFSFSGRKAFILMEDTEVTSMEFHGRIRDGLLGHAHPPDTSEVQPGTSLLLAAAVNLVAARMRLAAARGAQASAGASGAAAAVVVV